MTATAELTLTPEQEHDSAVELVAALEERVREGDESVSPDGDGHPVPAWAQLVCQALADVADAPCPAVGSATGTASESLEASTWAPVDEAADSAGCSASYARRLARSGRVRARRIGSRSWLIDIDSLARVLGRTAA